MMKLYVGNLLRDFVVVAMKRKNQGMEPNKGEGEHFGSRKLIRAASCIKSADLTKWGLSSRYLPILHERIGFYLHKRNLVAHESAQGLANLLMKERYFQQREYYAWGGLFEFTYGESVENMAEKYVKAEDKDLEGFGPE